MLIKTINDEKVFFTSDTHIGHENILKFCDRPFNSVEEMDDAIINNWNKVVGPDDYVFHLGDVAFGGTDIWHKFLDNVNGHIFLIYGNHDIKNVRPGYLKRFEYSSYQMYVRINDTFMYLNHCPLLCYGGMYKSIPQLFGHVHISKYKNTGKDWDRLSNLSSTQYDVGVDLNNFTPISFDKVMERIDFQINNNKTCEWWINHE